MSTNDITNGIHGMQRTIDGTEEPMKTKLHGPLQSTEDHSVFYGAPKYVSGEGPIIFNHEDLTNALEVMSYSEYIQEAYENGDTGEEYPSDAPCLLAYDWRGIKEKYPVEYRVLREMGCELTSDDEYVIPEGSEKIYRISTPYGSSNVQWWEEEDYWLTPDSPTEKWIEWAIEDPAWRHIVRPMGPEIVGEGFTEVDPMVYGPMEDRSGGWGTEKFVEALRKRYGRHVEIVLEHSGINWRGVYYRPSTEGLTSGLCKDCVTAYENGDYSAFDNYPEDKAGELVERAEEYLSEEVHHIDLELEPKEDYSGAECDSCGQLHSRLYWYLHEVDVEDYYGEAD